MVAKNKNNRFLGLLVIAVAIIAIPVSVQLVQKQQDIRKFAAPATTLSFTPTNTTVKAGDTFNLNGVITTGENMVSAAEIHLTFDRTKLEAISINQGTFFANPFIFIPGAVDNTNGTASITIGSQVNTQPGTGTGTLFVTRFKALSSGRYTINYAPTTSVSAKGEGSLNVLTGTVPANILVAIASDINNDGIVNILDFNILVTDFNKTGAPGFSGADVNKSGRVDIFDFNLMFEDYGKTV